MKLKILLWKLGKAWKLVWIWSLSWEVFYQTTSWMKANVMSNSKWHFPSFCKFLSDVTKTVFWESKKHCVKSVQIWSFTCPYFPVLGLNTEIYGINLRIQLRYWKIRTRKNSVFGHFARSEKVFKIVIIKSWSWETWNRFLEKRGKGFKIFQRRIISKNCFKAALRSKVNILSVWK